MSQSFSVDIVYCERDKQHCVAVQIQEGCSAAQAIENSNLLPRFDLRLEGAQASPIGIFGKKIPLDTILSRGDRLEIYRPLLLSPTEARRLRATSLQEPVQPGDLS